MYKVNKKLQNDDNDIRVKPFSSVSIVDLEQVNISWQTFCLSPVYEIHFQVSLSWNHGIKTTRKTGQSFR